MLIWNYSILCQKEQSCAVSFHDATFTAWMF